MDLDKRLRKNIVITGVVGLLLTHSPISIHAQEISQESILQLEQELSQKLNFANEKYRQVATLKNDLKELASNQALLEQQINQQQEKLVEKESVVKQRLLALQSSGIVYQRFIQLVQAASISDFFHRFFTIQELFKADILTIRNYKQEVHSLVISKQELKENEDSLLKKQQDLQTESTLYEESIQVLKQNLSTNKEALLAIREKVKQSSENEEPTTHHSPSESKKEEKVKESSIENSKETTSATGKKSLENQQLNQSSSKSKTVTSETNSSSVGKEFVAEATAYSYKQPGLNNYTAMGIDLRQNPNVIAVDPTQIPLGTLVEVPGYGIAIAGDTGADIKGNRIDLHYPEVQQAMDFGRKKITIKVMN
ncbi:3D domain-containing protein [Granulicatella elegans]|uniref:3D domain-containing protein n=1 Tax=Granulicatella elegans TaxID=137732 RepID=UPI001D13B90F|nr:3D domain-containing protein [Granulicatella elegans]UEA31078.1 hypothetical protein LK443_07340 [Granulicatella elegans]